MKFEIIATNPFERKLKKLAKKHKSLKNDLYILTQELSENPTFGTPKEKIVIKLD